MSCHVTFGLQDSVGVPVQQLFTFELPETETLRQGFCQSSLSIRDLSNCHPVSGPLVEGVERDHEGRRGQSPSVAASNQKKTASSRTLSQIRLFTF